MCEYAQGQSEDATAVFTPVYRLYKRIVQQEVQDTDIQHAVVIIPSFTDVMTDNDFRECVTSHRQGPVLCRNFSIGVQGIRRLNISPFAASRGYEIDLPCDLGALPLSVFLCTIDDADIHFAAADMELVIQDVLHDMRHLLLTETGASIAQTNIITVILIGIVEIVLAFYVIATAFLEQVGVQEMANIGRDRVCGNRVLSGALLPGVQGVGYIVRVGQ